MLHMIVMFNQVKNDGSSFIQNLKDVRVYASLEVSIFSYL